MIRAACIAVVVSAGLSGPAFSADADGRYAVEGPGRITCQALTSDGSDQARMREIAIWLSGYVTAHNRLAKDTFDLTPWETPTTLLALMGQYCKANPEHIVERAARELLTYLIPNRLTKKSPTVAQRADGSVVVVYAAVMERALRVLYRHGLPVEGAEPAEVANSIRAFQKTHGLNETGVLDQPTLARMMKTE